MIMVQGRAINFSTRRKRRESDQRCRQTSSKIRSYKYYCYVAVSLFSQKYLSILFAKNLHREKIVISSSFCFKVLKSNIEVTLLDHSFYTLFSFMRIFINRSFSSVDPRSFLRPSSEDPFEKTNIRSEKRWGEMFVMSRSQANTLRQ